MARKVRIFIKDASVHILLRALLGIELFLDEDDVNFMKQLLNELTDKYSVELHAYAFGHDYIEFLLTPTEPVMLSKFMQSLGRRYVSYFNKKYNRSGTLFEGRYKASLLEDELYLFDVMCFIEKKRVFSPQCSSRNANLYGKKEPVVKAHRLYKALAYTDEERCARYQALFKQKPERQRALFIEEALFKQQPTGSKNFINKLELEFGVALTARGRGRPKKRKKGKKMYKNLQILDKEKHKELKVSPMENLLFAKDVKFIPLLVNEVTKVGTNFPVVFSADEEPALMALVSLGGDSLAITEDGKWIDSYVPAFLRKYPFALAGTQENPEQKVVLIDVDSPLISKSKGKQLFKKNSEQSELLSNALQFLKEYDTQETLTKNVLAEIAKSGILEEREISVGEGEEKKVLVNGFRVVNREKLNALSDDILADWVRKGIIGFIDAHLSSLGNIQTLFNLAQQRQK